MYSNYLDNSMDMSRSTYSFEVLNLTIGGTRPYGYQDMVHRSFVSNIKQGDLNNVLNEVLRKGKLTNNSNVSNNLVNISAAPLGVSTISGGWHEQRYFFKLEVRCRPREDIMLSNSSTTYDLVLTGYSEPSRDFIHLNALGSYTYDENLIFTINSIQRIGVNETSKVVLGIDNVGVTNPNNYTNNDNDVCVRPLDIVSNINNKNNDIYNGVNTVMIDLTTNNTPVSFDRGQMVGRDYVKDLVNSTVEGLANGYGVRQGLNSLYNDKYNSAYVEATTILENKSNINYNDVFLIALNRINGYNGHMFTIRDLKHLDKHLDNKITYIDVNEQQRFQSDGMMLTNDTANLTSANVENARVSELHNALVSLMTSQFLSHLELSIWNTGVRNETGMLVLKPLWNIPDGPNSIAWSYNLNTNQEQLRSLLSNQINYMVNYVIDPLLSTSGNLQYHVVISADMAADTTIALSIENQSPIIYRFATFADMCFNPMVGNKLTKDNLVGNLSTVSDTVIDTLSGSDLNQYNLSGNGVLPQTW